MGAFTVCWLPFFILALIKPFCSNANNCIPEELSTLFLWLGFTNSFLNPIIYARFNRDFRTPFKEILLCRCYGIDRRLRSESYVEQFGAAGGPGGHGASAGSLQHQLLRSTGSTAADGQRTHQAKQSLRKTPSFVVSPAPLDEGVEIDGREADGPALNHDRTSEDGPPEAVSERHGRLVESSAIDAASTSLMVGVSVHNGIG